MFDVGFWEMSLIGLIALIILGPERLPKVARTAGLWMGRAKRMIGDVKADIDREVRNAEIKELDEVKKSVESVTSDANKVVSDMAKEELNVAESIRSSAEDISKDTKATND